MSEEPIPIQQATSPRNDKSSETEIIEYSQPVSLPALKTYQENVTNHGKTLQPLGVAVYSVMFFVPPPPGQPKHSVSSIARYLGRDRRTIRRGIKAVKNLSKEMLFGQRSGVGAGAQGVGAGAQGVGAGAQGLSVEPSEQKNVVEFKTGHPRPGGAPVVVVVFKYVPTTTDELVRDLGAHLDFWQEAFPWIQPDLLVDIFYEAQKASATKTSLGLFPVHSRAIERLQSGIRYVLAHKAHGSHIKNPLGMLRDAVRKGLTAPHLSKKDPPRAEYLPSDAAREAAIKDRHRAATVDHIYSHMADCVHAVRWQLVLEQTRFAYKDNPNLKPAIERALAMGLDKVIPHHEQQEANR